MSRVLRLYFHIDELSRDAVVASMIWNELKLRGHRIYLGNRFTTRILNKFPLLFRYSFDAIVLPRVHFFDGFDSFQGVKVVLYTECIGRAVSHQNRSLASYVLLDKSYVEGNSVSAELVDAFLCWGKTCIDFIDREHPRFRNKFKVVGHPRLDLRAYDKAPAIKKVVRVGIITRQCILNDSLLRTPKDAVINNVLNGSFLYRDPQTLEEIEDQDNELPERLYMEARELELYIRIIKALSEKDIDVEIRVHPREERNFWRVVIENNNLKATLCEWDAPFSHFLGRVNYVIGPASTSFYEALAASVTPILINKLDRRYAELSHVTSEDRNPLMQHIYSPCTIEELVQSIHTNSIRVKSSNEVDAILNYEANYPASRNSGVKIVDALESASKEIGCNKKTILCTFSSLILLRLGFLGLLHSAYFYVKGISQQSSRFSLSPFRILWVRRLCNKYKTT